MAETKLELVVTAAKALPAINSVNTQLKTLDTTASKSQSSVSGNSSAFSKLKGSMGGLGLAGIAAGFTAVAGSLAKVKERINFADDMIKQARALNMTVEEFSALDYAAGQMGLSTNELAGGIDKMERRLAMFAETGKGPAKQAFDTLGLSSEQVKTGIEQAGGALPFLMQELSKIEDPALRAHTAFIAGGKGLQELVAQTNGSIEPLNALKKEAAETGAVINTEFAERSERVNDMLSRMGTAINGVFMELAERLLPHFETFLENVIEKAPSMIEAVSNTLDRLSPLFDILGAAINVATPIVKGLFDVFVAGLDLIKPVVEYLEGPLIAAADMIGSAFTELPKLILETFTNIKQYLSDFLGTVKSWGESAYNFITSPFRDAEEEVVGNSIVPDMVNAVVSEFERMREGMGQSSRMAANETVSNLNTARSANENRVNHAINLEHQHQSAINATGQAITSTTSQIQSATSQVGGYIDSMFGKLESKGGLLGKLGGFARSSGIGSKIGNLFGGGGFKFGGFFADGGKIPAGRYGVTGERGPEMVRGPATVTPMGAGGNISFNFNVSGGGSGGSGYMGQQDLNRLAAGLIQEARSMMIKQQGFGGALGVR